MKVTKVALFVTWVIGLVFVVELWRSGYYSRDLTRLFNYMSGL